jgi:hypothetical protein
MMPAEHLTPNALDHALALARHGFRVLPIRPGGKHPPMAAWQDAASADEKTIRSWWNGIYRTHGVGIATGHLADGTPFFVLDVDDRAEFSGSDTLHDLEHTHGTLPDTIRSITGSGSSHQFLTVPNGRQTPRNDQSGKAGLGLDIRGEGGQVVVAPTVHPNGQLYSWEEGHAPGRIPMAEAPAWLLDLLEPEPVKATTPPKATTFDTFSAPSSPADRYNDSTTWADLLEADGWTLSHSRDGEDYWTRPGKTTREGTSATVGWAGNDALKVFTSSVPWLTADKTYSKFQYHALRHHGGNESEAARAVLSAEQPKVAPLPIQPVGAPQGHTEASQGITVPDTDSASGTTGADTDPYDLELRGMITDWPTFWARADEDAQWMMEPVIAEHRAHAIYAPGGTGKSLFSLWIAAALATGRIGLDGHPCQPRRVLYLDYEMTPEDVRERLENMGYDASCDLTNLHYAILPALPPADAPEGGKAIARLAQLVDAELVILDTFSRAVSGDENDADTVRAFYRWTLLHLKSEGRAFARIDHAGKDIAKGQRGSSAKNDDVDIVWKMVKADGGFTLTATKRRMGWVPEELALIQNDSPNLHYRVADSIAPAGTAKVIADLDDLKMPPSVSARKAAMALKEAGKGARDQLVRAAQKARFQRVFEVEKARPDNRDAPQNAPRPTNRDALDENSDPPGTDAVGTHRDAPPVASGTQCVTRRGTHAPSATQPPQPEDQPEELW